MNKKRLVGFINKYYLNGTVNSVVLNSKSDKLSARFISGDKTLLGELSLDKSQIEDCEIGVYNTEQFSKLLSVLDDDINVSINKAGGIIDFNTLKIILKSTGSASSGSGAAFGFI